MISSVGEAAGADLWLVTLDTAHDASILPPDELVGGCLDPTHAARLRASRVGMRLVLATYLGVPPARVRLGRTNAGRPVLAEHGIDVSLSRAGDVAVVAVARRRRVGVDVEGAPPPVATCDMLATRVLTGAELARFGHLTPDERREVFRAAWTRREAAVKAMGVGLFASDTPTPDETGAPALAVTGWRLARPRVAPSLEVAVVTRPG